MKPQPLQFSTPDDREELARAEAYGVLAQLFIAPPALELYEQLRVAPTEAPTPGGFLESSWGTLVASARRLPRETVAAEYDALFQGIGKPEIFLYGSFHLAGAVNDKPLVQLRHDLRALGLERAPGVGETEDHIASLCEVMRFLIAGSDPVLGSLVAQQGFYASHLGGWVARLCEQIAAHPRADFYRDLALFARDFFAVEQQAFDLLDA
jgi:TorA maturation chaperone TorD